MNLKKHVTIKPLTADHLNDVAALERLCFSRPWSRNMLAEELENDCSSFLVALSDDGALVGYTGLQVVLDEGYILNVAVHPEWRRNGIAEKLLRVFIHFAEANHLAFLTLEVRASNRPAIQLYNKLKFREAGRRRNYYEYPKEDAIIMTREFENESAYSDKPTA